MIISWGWVVLYICPCAHLHCALFDVQPAWFALTSHFRSQLFYELRVASEALALHQRCPGVVRSFLLGSVRLISRLAPEPAPAAADQAAQWWGRAIRRIYGPISPPPPQPLDLTRLEPLAPICMLCSPPSGSASTFSCRASAPVDLMSDISIHLIVRTWVLHVLWTWSLTNPVTSSLISAVLCTRPLVVLSRDRSHRPWSIGGHSAHLRFVHAFPFSALNFN